MKNLFIKLDRAKQAWQAKAPQEKENAGNLFVFIALFIFITWLLIAHSEIKQELLPSTMAKEKLSFNVPVPKEYNWNIFRNVLVGNYNDYQYHWTNYAWNTFRDKEFMYMLASENGLYNHDRKSLVKGEDSWGFCQIHRYYHPKIVNDPRFFTDPAWQLGECYRLFKGGTTFYGYNRFERGLKANASFNDRKFTQERMALFNFNQ